MERLRHAEGSCVFRRTRDLIEDFQTTANGFSHVLVSITDPNAGAATTDPSTPAFTNRIYQNTNLAHREYDALVFQSRYRINNWSVNGHYTVQLKNDGNYEGEGSSTPGSTVFSNSPSIIGNYPEAFNEARNYPDGRLQAFQCRAYLELCITWGMGLAGDMSISGLWRVDSGPGSTAWLRRNQVLTATQVALLMTAAGYPEAGKLCGTRSDLRKRWCSSPIAARRRSRATASSTRQSTTTSRCSAR